MSELEDEPGRVIATLTEREELARVLSKASAPNWWDGDTPEYEGLPADEDYAGADAVLHFLAQRAAEAWDEGWYARKPYASPSDALRENLNPYRARR